MYILFKRIIFTILLVSHLFSCSKEKEKIEPPVVIDEIYIGLSPNIQELVPKELLHSMEEAGMVINRGFSPPILVDSYLYTPSTLKATTDPYDSYQAGYQTADCKVNFYNQNIENNSISFDYKNGPESGFGLGALIAGTNQEFTIFAKVKSKHTNGSEVDIINVLSAKLDSNSLKNFHLAYFMLDDYGDPTNTWMEEGVGRIIYDADFISEQEPF
jgi:hypothetical protein